MKKLIILIPVYNDWESVFKLLENIDSQIEKWNSEVSVLIINDASTEKITKNKLTLKRIKLVRVVNMKKNTGHARCNAAGLKFVTEKEDFDHVILMDGDGEDRPEELSLLFNKSADNLTKPIVANRIKRSDGIFFKILYELHKIFTYVFTGKLIKFGNYSLLPRATVLKLVKEASIWNSFSGTLTKITSDLVSIPSIKGKRYFGPSKMNFFNLIIHSFSIIAVFKITVIFRSILFLFLYLFFISNNLSVITFFPVVAIIIFLLLIFKVSFRENINGLNNSLKNIDSIDFLSEFNDR